ncbi:MAG: DHH family phosphoesterase [Desulfamplus sp.]|nr:DHH family phosphoesterase [Desulfamplus sp.]
MQIKARDINHDVYSTCIEQGYPEVVARIIAGRTDTFDKNIFEFTLDAIKPADTMEDCTKAALRIANAIQSNNETILLFTDYDVDGCTSMAVMYETLHDVFDVPDSRLVRLTGHRTDDGYGLTDSVADKIISINPGLVITADAGASDGARIKRLADAGIDVIVTDHHLIPKEGIPDAAFAVVNPHRKSCQYDSRIAGCGVAWLLMTALSRQMECTIGQKQMIHQLLDYVALGTVADLVPLTSVINRYFVKKGLEFMNRRSRPCWQVALNGKKTDNGYPAYTKEADTGYLAFQLAPRINASSRMTSEALTALNFLLESTTDRTACAYQQLDGFNKERQQLEKKMFNAAKESLDPNLPVLVHYSENNHPGIQGIVAGRLAENFGIPVVMLADIGNGAVSGSGRAGQFLHIRDALQTFDDRFPGLFIAYGGHRAAAGFKLRKEDIDLFKKELPHIVTEQLAGQDTTPYLQTDGSLKVTDRDILSNRNDNGFADNHNRSGFAQNRNDNGFTNNHNNNGYIDNHNNNSLGNSRINLETYYQIESLKPFGMGFPSPLFNDRMVATDVRVMGKNPVHLSMLLDGVKAAFFYALDKPGDPLPVNSGDIVDVVYTLDLNSWQGRDSLQLIVKKIIPVQYR